MDGEPPIDEGRLKLLTPCEEGAKLRVLSKFCRISLPEPPEDRVKVLTPCEAGVKFVALSKCCRVSLPEPPEDRVKFLTPCEEGVKLLVLSKFCRINLPEPPEGRLNCLLSGERGLIVLPSCNDLVRFLSENFVSLPRTSPVINALESCPRLTTKESPLNLDTGSIRKTRCVLPSLK